MEEARNRFEMPGRRKGGKGRKGDEERSGPCRLIARYTHIATHHTTNTPLLIPRHPPRRIMPCHAMPICPFIIRSQSEETLTNK